MIPTPKLRHASLFLRLRPRARMLATLAVASGLLTANATKVAAAAPSSAVASREAGTLEILTAPLPAMDLPASGRLAVCVIVAGAPNAGGELQLLTGVNGMSLRRAGGTPIEGVGELVPDTAAEHAAQRLLDALKLPGPVELFGMSAPVEKAHLPAGETLELAWHASLRAGVSSGEASGSLQRFHAVVIGTLAADGTFGDQVTYTRIRNAD